MQASEGNTYKAIVLGASSGGITVVGDLVRSLPADFSMPLIVVQHVAPNSDDRWAHLLNDNSAVLVKEADEKESILPGTVYLAPANYHLLVETDGTFTLTLEERVNYARPAIDVLFETAAEAWGKHLIGIVCTGANFDGAEGLRLIGERGGLTVVQNPSTADVSTMPLRAIELAHPDYILTPQEILELLIDIHRKNQTHEL